MKKFNLKVVYFLSPFLVIVVFFTYLDVFKIFGRYDDYYKDNFVGLNREYICAETYNKNRTREKFNSFIFGSSRSQAFKVKEWSKYLEEGDKPFHFDASGEGIYGILRKIQYIDELGDNINKALIVVDNSTLNLTSSRKGHLFIPPVYISKESKLDFYLTFLEAQLNPKFIVAYLDYSIFKTYRKYMGNLIQKNRYPYETNIENCDIWYGADEHIKKDSLGYYQELIQKEVFYKRSREDNRPVVISKTEESQAKDIKKIFNKHSTDYKIIVSPVYDQIKLDEARLKLLYEVFGKENVYDFSGKNKFTNPISNYYEASHYRPNVANEILSLIYDKGINK